MNRSKRASFFSPFPFFLLGVVVVLLLAPQKGMASTNSAGSVGANGLPVSFAAFTSSKAPNPTDEIKQLILAALAEDVGPGDVSTLGECYCLRSCMDSRCESKVRVASDVKT